MCIKGLEVEKRKQDSEPRLVHRRETPQITQVEEWIRERRDSETIIMPISPGELYGRHNWLPENGPLIVEISPPVSPRNRSLEVEVGCGAFFIVVEDNLVKKRSCRHRHRCQKCKDRLAREKAARDAEDRKRHADADAGRRSEKKRQHHQKHHDPKAKSSLHDIINRIADLLYSHGDRNEEVRRLRVELQKIKAEDKAEGRKLDHIERLLEDVAASPRLSSPSLEDDRPQHSHLRHHETTCGCHHCHPPRAPPSTPSVWQGPYGCEPPRFSIPAGKRTHKHHKHREREEKRRHGPWHSADNSLTNSTITDGSGSSSSSRASRIARESFDRVRNFAMRQGRKLKEMDAKISAARERIDEVDAKVEKTEKHVEGVESGLKEVHAEAHKAESRVHGTEAGLKAVQGEVHGLGLRLDEGLARGEVLGVQLKQVDARASIAHKRAHQLESKVKGLAAQDMVQRENVHKLDSKLAGLAVRTEMQREDARRLNAKLGGLAGQTDAQREDANKLAKKVGGLAAQTEVQRQNSVALTRRVDAVEQDLNEQDETQRHESLALAQRVDTMVQDLIVLDERQRRDERRIEGRWRGGDAQGPLRGFLPSPRHRTNMGRTYGVEVEFEEEIDVERIERIRRTKSRSRSREGRWQQQSPDLGRDLERPASYTRRRSDARPAAGGGERSVLGRG